MRVLSSYDFVIDPGKSSKWAVMLELRLVSGRFAFKFRVGKSNFVCMNVKPFALNGQESKVLFR